MTMDEKKKAIQEAIRIAGGKVKVIAGTGSNSTKATVDFTRWAKEAGADGCLIVNPYYNRPSQEGLYLHCKAVSEVGLPVMLYNIPGRTACHMSVDTAVRLSALPGIVAIKEATGSLDQATETVLRAPGLTLLSGDDTLTLPLLSVGGAGAVSVISNLVPEKVVAMVGAARGGDFATAMRIHQELYPLCKAMFVETNPVPIKYAMSKKGLMRAGVRLPLARLAADSMAVVDAAVASVSV